jgi:hypothetical protein
MFDNSSNNNKELRWIVGRKEGIRREMTMTTSNKKRPSLSSSSLTQTAVPFFFFLIVAGLLSAPSLAMAQLTTAPTTSPSPPSSSPLSLTPQEQLQQARLQNITATITQSLAQGQRQIGGVVFTPRWSDPVWVEPGLSSVLFAYCLPGEFAYGLPGEFVADSGQEILGGPELVLLDSYAAAVTPDLTMWFMVVQNQDVQNRLPAAAGVICASDINDAQARVLSPEEQQQVNNIISQFTNLQNSVQGTTTIDQVVNIINNNNAANQNNTTTGTGGTALPSTRPQPGTTTPDTTAPTLTVPFDMALQTNGPTALLEYSVRAQDDRDGIATLDEDNQLIQNDNVGGSIIISCSPSSQYFLPVGNRTVECSAFDAANNTGTASFVVSVTRPTTLPGGSSGSGGGITASLTADPATYNAPCPTPFNIYFTGTITDNVGNRDVHYRIIYDDDVVWVEEQVIHFDQPGSQSVSTNLASDVLTADKPFQGWMVIEILQPVNFQSNKAYFEVTCTPSTGAAAQAPQTLQAEDNTTTTATDEEEEDTSTDGGAGTGGAGGGTEGTDGGGGGGGTEGTDGGGGGGGTEGTDGGGEPQ